MSFLSIYAINAFQTPPAPLGMLNGINFAGMEFGNEWGADNYINPGGWSGQTYYYNRTNTELDNQLAYFATKGMNTVRLPISWERLQHTLNGSFSSAYQADLERHITKITGAGFYCIIDLHSYTRYATGAYSTGDTQVGTYTSHVLGDGTLSFSHYNDVWIKIANIFKTNSKVIFELINEPHDFQPSITSVEFFSGCQGIINAIRGTGSTNLILVPNTRGSDSEHWNNWSPAGGPKDSVQALTITDSANNFAFAIHSYWWQQGSYTTWKEVVQDVVNWAITNSRKLMFTEIGTQLTGDTAKYNVQTVLQYLNQNSSVVLGWQPWNLPPHNLSMDTGGGNLDYLQDGPMMAWYAPYFGASVDPPAPPAFDPADIPNKLTWLDSVSSTISPGTLDSGISSVSDLSGNNNTWNGTSPNRPVYQSNDFKGSKPSLQFPEWETDFFNRSAITFNNGFSFFATFKTIGYRNTRTYTENSPMTILGKNASPFYASVGLNGTTGNVELEYSYLVSGTWYRLTSSGANLNNGVVRTIGVSHDKTSGVIKLFVDGSQVATSTRAYDASTAFDRIGVGRANADQALTLSIGNMFLVNGTLSPTNISDLHTYGIDRFKP